MVHRSFPTEIIRMRYSIGYQTQTAQKFLQSQEFINFPQKIKMIQSSMSIEGISWPLAQRPYGLVQLALRFLLVKANLAPDGTNHRALAKGKAWYG